MDHFKKKNDRGRERSTSELRTIFVFNPEDNTSTDIPKVLRFVCAYRVGLQIVKQLLENVNNLRHTAMETDASDADPPDMLDDFASDSEFMKCGIMTKEYPDRLKLAQENARTYTWMDIYEQYIMECSKEERDLAKTVQHLRQHPDEDVDNFCVSNLIRHTEENIKNWQRLTAIAIKIINEMQILERSAYPCLEPYSNIELYRWDIQFSDQSAIPDNWKHLDQKHSNINKIKTEVEYKSDKLSEIIKGNIKKMDDLRKENFLKLHTRHNGLMAIISKLQTISSEAHKLAEGFTEEEIWYNKFDLSYVDTLYQNTDVRVDLEKTWDNTTQEERPSLSRKALDECTVLRQRYGELVKTLRNKRESMYQGTKTHVSELEAMVAQLRSDTHASGLEAKIDQLQRKVTNMEKDFHGQKKQMQNEFEAQKRQWYEKDFKTVSKTAELTNQLDVAKQEAENIKMHWRQYAIQVNSEHHQQLNLQKTEAEQRIAELKEDKEKLLTRLSKIAGNKLVQGNPAITDLSDVNRPTKLSERYSELYDNEWTDALEELTDSIVQGGEVVCTKTLLGILIEAFTFCCETEVGYVKTIKDSLTTLPGSGPGRTEHEQKDTTDSITLSEEQGQQLNDLMKTCVPMMTKTVELKFLTQMEKLFDHVIKTAGGSIKHDFQTPLSEHKEQKTLSDPNEPKTTAYTEDQATGPGNTDHGGKDHINTNEDVSTPKSNTNILHPSGVEQATADTSDIGTTPSKQAPTDRASEKHHRKFEFGPSNVTSNQTNQQNDDTSSESDTTDTTFQIRFSSLAHTYKFAKSCVNLCWLMRIQNPPLHMDTELVEGSDINGEFYKNYTQKGKQVGYLVWPALFLHKDGPLLCKGIVQPSSNRKP